MKLLIILLAMTSIIACQPQAWTACTKSHVGDCKWTAEGKPKSHAKYLRKSRKIKAKVNQAWLIHNLKQTEDEN